MDVYLDPGHHDSPILFSFFQATPFLSLPVLLCIYVCWAH